MHTRYWDYIGNHENHHARSRQIHEWWIEFKVAMQYSKSWDDVEEMATLARIRSGFEPPPTTSDAAKGDDGTWRQASHRGISSAPYWMQQVHVPRWFKHDELGIGTSESIHATLATLETKNRRRRAQYEKRLKDLAKARVVLRRTVRG